ncbi:MAG: molybdenum cofactor guanylyltransferase [Thermomicrobia bacterium]|nr:molybdenum cofactor guanylyltransferase [Thermomicrobia bacterium]MCA1724980.1 molybdenum cofactor guanylyltransferase [Thermomicrobia bacterium]
MTSRRLPITAVILAGGRSRRMGADKALLRLPSGGATLIERVVAAARAVSDDIVIVAADTARLPAMTVRTVPDAIAGAGPLAGLVAGFAAAHYPDILALACDLPYLSVPLLQWMAALPQTWDALVPYRPNDDGKAGWQPLHAIYARACLAPMRAAFERGDRQATAFFPAINVRPLTAEAMQPYDPAGRSIVSVNTPDAWAEAARWLHRQSDAILRPE